MRQAAIVPSMDSVRDALGARAARHMETVFRTLATGDGRESGDGWFRWLTGEAHPLGNFVLMSDPSDGGRVRAAVEPLVLRADLPSAAIFPAGASTHAGDALRAAGYRDVPAIPAMAVDIERLAPAALPAGFAFVRVLGDRLAPEWARALADGYGLPFGLARRLSPLDVALDPARDAQTQFFAVVRGDRVVATSMLFLDDGLAGVYSVATLAEERGKGIGAHATAQALRNALALGYRVGVLQSSQAGHPVYRRLGFTDVGALPMFVRLPAP